ncbi:hypothetical protein [Cupriavidus necator]
MPKSKLQRMREAQAPLVVQEQTYDIAATLQQMSSMPVPSFAAQASFPSYRDLVNARQPIHFGQYSAENHGKDEFIHINPI